MHRRNAVTHALLNSDTLTSIYLIQEPWFDTIGTARQDTARQGVDILGGVASPGWEILYPAIPKGQRPKVMAYVQKWIPNTQTEPPFMVVPRLDVSNHPCVQVLDIIFDKTNWRIINFYHDIRDASCLPALTTLDIDPLIPTLAIGDFNTHSSEWSPRDVPWSNWAGQLEEWANRNLLALANNPGEVTCRGAEHECDLVIDLAWVNTAAAQMDTFTNLRVDWEGSLGSDHACLRIVGTSQWVTNQPTEGANPGYVVNPERKEEWIKHFKDAPPSLLLPSTPTAEEVEQAAAELYEHIQSANEKTFCRRCPFHPKAAPWWNEACARATQTLCSLANPGDRNAAHTQLRRTVRAAKCQWADEYITNSNLWDIATWRHGRKISKVPSLCGPNGLAHMHGEVAEILSQRFFVKTPPQVNPVLHDDPPQLPMRQLPPINKQLIEPLLKKAATKSAPGQSGHMWTILKWAWEADAERITDLLSACITAGHHPRQWKEAIVCVIPKPNRADYTLAKNFRPISLLECMGKLLEKVVVKLIQYIGIWTSTQ